MTPGTLATALSTALILSLSPGALDAQPIDPQQVSVLGRNWVVAPVEAMEKTAFKAPVQAPAGYYQATRLNTELLPFRAPAILSARQAVRAFRAATGCTPDLDSLYRSISGTYYAALTCPEN